MINLHHRRNEIAMDFSQIESVACIDIRYKGKMYAESMLPDDWQIFERNGRIICISLGNSIPELLFQYTGLIEIEGGMVVDRNLNKYPIYINVHDIDYWENITGEYDKDSTVWTNYSGVHTREKGLLKTSIVRNGLVTKPNEFYYADGTVYEGEYHQHEDGQAMTGGLHNEDSVDIYRKREDGELYNPRKRRSKRSLVEIVKTKLKPVIERSRAETSGTKGFKYEGDPTEGTGTAGVGAGSSPSY
tara:strand:- start:1825 stop:2559 length:735 start_codon:yes stop_codon:yes gene_type:complete